MGKKSKGAYKRWQKRYFTVRGHYLKYFKDEYKDKIKGVMDLLLIHKVQTQTDTEGNVIVLEFRGVKAPKVELLCESDSDLALWLQVFRSFECDNVLMSDATNGEDGHAKDEADGAKPNTDARDSDAATEKAGDKKKDQKGKKEKKEKKEKKSKKNKEKGKGK